MCGIFAIFSSALPEADLRRELITCSSRLRHRGPDWSGYMVISANPENGIAMPHGIAHERLAIMDPESGSQPLVSHDGSVICAANGEIYNYKELYETLHTPYTPKTGSDCEVILPLYDEHGPTIELPRLLRGMFSFILYDRKKDLYFIVRAPEGIGERRVRLGGVKRGAEQRDGEGGAEGLFHRDESGVAPASTPRQSEVGFFMRVDF